MILQVRRSLSTAAMRLMPHKFPSINADCSDLKSIRYKVEGQVAHIELHRPSLLNAIDLRMPFEIQTAVENANANSTVKVILLYGAGNAFCAGYDLKHFAEQGRERNPLSQTMPWDPYTDYAFMGKCTDCFMSVWRSHKPVVAKIKRVAIGGGSDLALACDVTFIADEARIGYPPSRVWGCPTTAMWVYRVGIERAKRILFTGQILSGTEAAEVGLIGQSVAESQLDDEVDEFVQRMVHVPSNQLFFQKQVINNAIEMLGLFSSQRLATFIDGMTRHTPEGFAFQQRAEEVGFKKAVKERDSGKETVWSAIPPKGVTQE